MLTIMLVELNNMIACFINVSWSLNLFESKLKKGDLPLPFKRIGQADCEIKSFFILRLGTTSNDFGKIKVTTI